MKKSIIVVTNTPTNITLYIKRPFWSKYWREGRCRKRLAYYMTPFKDEAHKFTKRKNLRFIMNDIASRSKMNPRLIQCQ